jgi:transposase-like protein
LNKSHRVGGAYSFFQSFFVEHHWYCLYMSEQTSRSDPIIEQVDQPLAMGNLPPPNIRRWITQRKAEVVTAVRTGLLSLDEACVRYGITSEEFLSWQRLLDEHGLQGLRATRLQKYRLSTNTSEH